MLLPANINSLYRRLPVLADRTLWRQGAALDRAGNHGIDAGAVAATVVAGRLFTDAIRRNSAVAV